MTKYDFIALVLFSNLSAKHAKVMNFHGLTIFCTTAYTSLILPMATAETASGGMCQRRLGSIGEHQNLFQMS